MANKQLVRYIREQLSHKMDTTALRNLLTSEGWNQSDIEDAFDEVYNKSYSYNHAQHHTHFVAISVVGVIILLLAGALFLVVFKEPTNTAPVPTQNPIVQNQPAPTQLTGWVICSQEDSDASKDLCYKKLNTEDELFDCDSIDDTVERNFCYRAKEAVLLDQYNARA